MLQYCNKKGGVKMRVLESRRLLIKPTEEKDIMQLLGLRWDADITRHLIHEPISEKQQRDWFNNIPKTDLVFSIFYKNKSKLNLVGTIGLYGINPRHQRASWRIRLSQKVQGKGIGFEAAYLILDYAFKTLNLRKITSDAFLDNEATIKMHKKLGDVIEGTLQEHYYQDGMFKDAVIFGLLRKNFYKATKNYETKIF